MAEYTSNYNLEKQQGNEYINIEGLNSNFDTIDEELKRAHDRAEEAFQSASNGKQLIAGAITGKGVPTDPADTFQQMADNISAIETGTKIIGEGVATGKYIEDMQKGQLVVTRRHFGMDDPVLMPAVSGITNPAYCTAFSPDGTYLAVGGTWNGVAIYKRNGDTFTKLANPDVLPNNTLVSMAFSPDGNHLAILSTASPYVYIYKRSGDTFTKLANLSDLNITSANVSGEVKFSASGTYLGICSGASTSMLVYKRSGDSYTRIKVITESGGVKDFAFTHDEAFLFIAYANSSTADYAIRMYERNGDNFTLVPNGIGTNLMASPGSRIAISPDSVYLFVIWGTTGCIFKKTSAKQYTKLLELGQFSSTSGQNAVFSSDGKYLYITYYSNQPNYNFYRYKREGDTFTLMPQMAQPIWAYTRKIGVCDLEPYFAVAIDVSPYVFVYKADVEGDFAYKYTNLTSFNLRNYINFGYTREAGNANTIHDIVTLPLK